SAYLDFYFQQYQSTYAAKRGGEPYQGWHALWFPWDVTMHPESFERSARQTLDLGPVALAFLPSIVLARHNRLAIAVVASVRAAFVAIVTVAAWPHPRYVLPGFTLCIAAALAGARALLGTRGLRLMLVFTIVGNVALTCKLLAPTFPDQVRV